MMKLRELAEKMETLIRDTEDQLRAEIGTPPGRVIRPWMMRDQSGRFIMLDIYAAYGQVRAALAQEETAQQKVVEVVSTEKAHPPHEEDGPNRGFVFRQGDAVWLRNYLVKSVLLSDRDTLGFSEPEYKARAERIVGELDGMNRPR